MAQSASLQTQGLEKLLKKLDAPTMTKPVQKHVFISLTRDGADTLRGLLAPNFPQTAGSVRALFTDDSGTIRAQRHPYVFFERGSQYPTGGIRSHRVRRGVKNSALRIAPRRFLSKTRAVVRKGLPKALDLAAKDIEKGWAA